MTIPLDTGNGKICVVTGGTSGIGFATSMGMAHLGFTTVVVGRDEKRCDKAVRSIKAASGNTRVECIVADLSSQRDIRLLAEQVKNKYEKLHVLINNAGAKILARQVTVDGYEMTFALNHLGYFLTTNLLLELMKKSGEARIVNVSSGAHGGCSKINFDDLQSAKGYIGKKAYAQSKLANILFTYELSRCMQGTGVTANVLHPGGVISKFCRNNGWISWLKHVTYHLMTRTLASPKEGAKTSIYLATSPEVAGVSGKYFVNQKPVRSSDASYDREAARQLWDISLELTGLA